MIQSNLMDKIKTHSHYFTLNIQFVASEAIKCEACVLFPTVLNHDIPHIFAMTLFEEFIYWTDWETKSINRAHKTLGTNKTMLISTLHRPMDIHIYHPSRQPEGEKINTWKCSCSI